MNQTLWRNLDAWAPGAVRYCADDCSDHVDMMRELFDEIIAANPLDPIESTRRSMRRPLRARFFNTVQAEERNGEFRIALDGHPIKTPGRRILRAPRASLAELIATEWAAQRDLIDPAK